MVSVFFTKAGINSINVLESNNKATATWYKDQCLHTVFSNWKSSNKKCGFEKILLHHDNAPIHRSTIINEYLNEMGIKTLKHPSYSPDLSPCDFWLFPTIKQRLRGRVNYSRSYVIIHFFNEVNKLEPSDFHKCFNVWIERCKTVVSKKGNYF